MSKTAIYAGTFDPITNGHVEIASRAAKIFDRVVIGVATSERKSPLISVIDRLEICENVFAQYDNIEVDQMNDLAVDFAQKYQAICMIRGIRSVTDLDYELSMIAMNRQMAPEIDTILLPATADYAYISGTMVREIIGLGKDISQFVPQAVVEYFR